MGNTFCGRRWLQCALILFCFGAFAAQGKHLTLTISETETPSVIETEGSFWVNALNTTDEKATWIVPNEIKCQIVSAQGTIEVSAQARQASVEPVTIAPGTFARCQYSFKFPEPWTGQFTLEFREFPAARLTFEARPSPSVSKAEPEAKGMVYFLKGRGHAKEAGQYDPDSFFKQHIFGYDPLYFIAGTDSPNAKFQISFKYRVLNDRGWLAQKAPWLVGLHGAYSQTSLWDWNADSAPFFDSSYRPEMLYSWDGLIGGGLTNWFRLDLQGGVQHESNGRDGSSSRSLNIAYLRPRLIFGQDSGPQLTLIPRAWVYVGDLNDNSDMADYRGYADLRAAFGWKRGLQISALGRLGQRLSQGSVTVDVTYPLMQPPNGSFSMYLHGQYFTGYGESLIGYKERTDIFRLGVSLYR
ncbi:MAG: phospholipase A [Akkermansiaceae bacterium]|nr:phospholipase A [Verrucomicrobiales bacterium]